MLTLLTTLLLAAPFQDADDPKPPAVETPPPLETVAGLVGLTTVSTVRFPSQPETAYRLETNYAFPERARWELSLEGQGRQVDHRYGDALFRTPFLETASIPLEGPDGAWVRSAMELRRALFLWPDGFAWSGEGGERNVQLSEFRGAPGAELVATLGDDGRPLRVVAHRGEDAPIEVLEVREGWFEHGERWWPRRVELRLGDAVPWDETVEQVDTRRRWIEAFFVPLDRRAEVPLASNGLLLRFEVPALVLKAVPLDDAATWPKALARASTLHASRSSELGARGLRVDPSVRVGVDGRGRPESLLLGLREAEGAPPDGWKRLTARRAVAFVLETPEQVTRARVDELLAAIPEGSRAELGYVRRVGDADSDAVQLVVLYSSAPAPKPAGDDPDGE